MILPIAASRSIHQARANIVNFQVRVVIQQLLVIRALREEPKYEGNGNPLSPYDRFPAEDLRIDDDTIEGVTVFHRCTISTVYLDDWLIDFPDHSIIIVFRPEAIQLSRVVADD